MKLIKRVGGLVLVSFDKREAMSLRTAAETAGKCENTIRYWCEKYEIGRKLGGRWVVSRVALAMFLDGDGLALAAYLSGDRESDFVVEYFSRFDLKAKPCPASQ